MDGGRQVEGYEREREWEKGEQCALWFSELKMKLSSHINQGPCGAVSECSQSNKLFSSQYTMSGWQSMSQVSSPNMACPGPFIILPPCAMVPLLLLLLLQSPLLQPSSCLHYHQSSPLPPSPKPRHLSTSSLVATTTCVYRSLPHHAAGKLADLSGLGYPAGPERAAQKERGKEAERERERERYREREREGCSDEGREEAEFLETGNQCEGPEQRETRGSGQGHCNVSKRGDVGACGLLLQPTWFRVNGTLDH
ncbi:hypothetical protein INR49_023285 [Caranx melampygus]|nr:hypothetical protein INR49_023285 [Caranx melampygus]